MSQIDHILYFVPEETNIEMKLHSHLCKLENFANLSAHDALVGTILLPIVKKTKEETDYSSSYTPFLVSKPKWNGSGLLGYQDQSEELIGSIPRP